MNVEDTPFDFRGGKKAPLLISANKRLEGACGGNGIDQSFIINRPEYSENTLQEVGILMHHSTGREMKISTTQTNLQVYTGNYLHCFENRFDQYAAIALETTGFNDAVNKLGTIGWPEEHQVLL